MAAPALPAGFTLDRKAPPLPAGFTLDKQVASAPAPAAPEPGLSVPGVDYGPEPTPAPPVDPNRQLSLDLLAANKGMIADTLGMPVDLTTAAMNGGSYLANMVAKLFGAQNDVTPYIQNPAGGSQSIAALGGQAYKLLTGKDVYQPETPAERMRYNTVEIGANAGATEGISPLLRAIANAGRVENIARPTTTSTPIFREAEPVALPNPETIGKATLAGAGAGAAQGAYREYAPDAVKDSPAGPILDLLAAALGGVGGKAIGDVGKAASNVAAAPVRRAVNSVVAPEKNAAFTMQDGTTATNKDLDVAAGIVQKTATDPLKAKQAVADTTNQLGGASPVVPTTGAMSGDAGMVGLEQKLRMDPNYRPAFIQRDQEVQQAALTAAGDVAPSTAVGRTFTDAANAEQAAREAAGRADVAATEANLDSLGQQQAQSAGTVLAAKGTEPAASAALDTTVKTTLRSAQEKKNQAFAEIDPRGEVPRPVAPLAEKAKAVKDEAGALAGPNSTPDELISRIEKAAGEDGDGTVSFRDINALRPEITARIAEARKAQNYPLADSLQTIKKAIDDDVANLATEGSDAGKRAQAALDIYKNEFAPVWNAGPGDEAAKFRKDFNLDRTAESTTPPSQTAGRFLQPGQPEKAASLKRIIDSSSTPKDGERAVGQYLMADLATSGAVDAKGAINPAALKTFRQKWGTSIDMSPDFKAQLDALESGATADSAKAVQLKTQLRQQQAALAEIEKNDTAFRHVVGKSPSNAVASIFSSDDPERAVEEIMGRIGKGSAAHDGLKASVREYLVEKGTTSALQKTSTGDNPLSFAKLDTLFKQNQKALSRVFSPEEMASLQAAHKFLASLKNLEMQSLAGSATAERQGLGDKMWRVVEIGLKTLHGGLRGGNEVRNLKLAAALQGGGPDQVAKLLVEMQFNPELAMHLFGRNVPKAGNTKFDAKLFNRLVLTGSVARGEPKKRVEIEVPVGKTPANSVEKN